MLWTRYAIGYHGCDESLAKNLVCKKANFRHSSNDYDWLGHGTYFWEGSPERALKWAEDAVARTASPVKRPCVVGAVIDLGECLNLVEAEYLAIVNTAYAELAVVLAAKNLELPKNTGIDLRSRKLDCAVFQALHEFRKQDNLPAFDTVRAFFMEGEALYPTAGIRHLDHIQICVRNPKQIVGCFLP